MTRPILFLTDYGLGLVDSAGWLAVARNLGRAADGLRVAAGDVVLLAERR